MTGVVAVMVHFFGSGWRGLSSRAQTQWVFCTLDVCQTHRLHPSGPWLPSGTDRRAELDIHPTAGSYAHREQRETTVQRPRKMTHRRTRTRGSKSKSADGGM